MAAFTKTYPNAEFVQTMSAQILRLYNGTDWKQLG